MRLRNILLLACCSLFATFSHAQPGPTTYAAKWKKVDSLVEQKGLTQSALQEVNSIYLAAKKEKNDAQVIRALIYRMSLGETQQENSLQKNIAELEKEIATATPAARAILQSILAEVYWNYFQRHRYQLYDRTNTTGLPGQDKPLAKSEDPATWAIDDFHRKIGGLYQASLREEKLLLQTPLTAFDPILIKGNARMLRPTLFDLLAHRALAYFKTDERDANKPAYAFEIDDPQVFADAGAFAGHIFRSSDSLSLHFYALQLFQRLIRRHLDDARPDALLDVDVERLAFAQQYGVMEDKDSLYMRALATITTSHGNEPLAAEAWYLQAQQYANQAAGYEPPHLLNSTDPSISSHSIEDSLQRYGYVKAKALCEKVLAQKDSSEGKSHCAALLQQILHKELSIQTEKVNLPGQPFRSLIGYRNFPRLYFRLCKVERSMTDNLGNNSWQDEYWKKVLQWPSVRTFSQAFPETNDYRQHQAEIKIDALPPGKYALIASVGDRFELGRDPMAVQYFYVSTIADINSGRDYFILNRESGQPLAGAAVQIWNREYDYQAGKQKLVKAETYQADQHGYFLLKERKDIQRNTPISLEITTKDDHLFTEDQETTYYYDNGEDGYKPGDKDKYEQDHRKTFFFTDRSIYRPGQTVYFKGIVVTQDFDTRLSKISPSFKTKVALNNADGEKIDSLEFQTNEFGSFHGKFTLPDHGLTGQFSIEDLVANGDQSFSVEEYKRPKFYLEYEKLKGSHRLGDSIAVKGFAKAYAGNSIDGALVKYRVVRQARFPDYWSYWRGRIPADGQEIAHGEARTDADGGFRVGFKAVPDRSVGKGPGITFDYRVSADITDINGETRSGETSISIGYATLQVSFDAALGDYLPADSLRTLVLQSANLSGEPEPAPTQLRLYRLKAPDRLIRERFWPQPDQFVLSPEEYLAAFPHDEYRDETNKETWVKEELPATTFRPMAAVNKSSDSAAVGMTRFGLQQSLQPGWYLAEATTVDQYGQLAKALKYIELYDGKTGQPAAPQYLWESEDPLSIEPGNTATLSTGSSAGNLFVIRRRMGNPRQRHGFSFYELNRQRQQTGIPITEADRGGFQIADVFVKDNRCYTNIHAVPVPWTNKELKIHYTTWRDKTLPGSQEKWEVKITGNKGDKVSAEVLTGLYDASLDQFLSHSWNKPGIYPSFDGGPQWSRSDFAAVNGLYKVVYDPLPAPYVIRYDRLLTVSQPQRIMIRGMATMSAGRVMPGAPSPVGNEMYVNAEKMKKNGANEKEEDANKKADTTLMLDKTGQPPGQDPRSGATNPAATQIRRNFNETAFFLPDLRTDSAGNTSFSFTIPEALTTWKWMTLAHTKDLAFGYSEKSIITQKQLMVQPNAPRFLREGDRMELSAKIVNLTDSEMTGQVTLQLTDPTNNQSVDGWWSNRQPNQYFTVGARQSVSVGFAIEIPYQYNRPLTYRIVANARNYSDGEEATLPVVSNRMLVTESLPLNMPGNGTRMFKFDKLLQSAGSETLNHHAVTVEFTSNPAWYAVQALPYLMEYPYECAEQTFNRYYSNALASMIAGNPLIRRVFEKWKTADTAALLSNLQKNQELKSILLEETPWVFAGKSEAQQKKNIALLFDSARMEKELGSALDKLQEMQSPNGGFVWFKGGPDDRYITQYILTGIGHLRRLKAIPAASLDRINAIVSAALPYLDKKIKQDYEELKKLEKASAPPGKNGTITKGKTIGRIPWPDHFQVQYLYMRSLFNEQGIPGDVFPAINYYRKQAQQSWLQMNKYLQGMIALALYRTGDLKTAKDIIASLQQNAIRDEEKGMYWKDPGGYYWYQAPIETQALLIEAFHEISPNAAVDRDLKTWLLKQKQTRNWPTTRSTADACYALLWGSPGLLAQERKIDIRLGDKIVSTTGEGAVSAEAGTGYFKKVFDGPFVNPSMGNIGVTMSPLRTVPSPANQVSPGPAAETPAWGAVYWQYFDNLDRITPPGSSKAPLQLSKQLFVEKNTDRGPLLEPIPDNGFLQVGDKIKVRIELKVDRDMEYVHMKDMRAACMEPVNVLSGYKWQGGLGYYESTRDAATDFFFSWLPKGTYVFEYPVFVGQTGNFSNGVSSIECMYAPEFSFHSEGIRVNVEERHAN